MGNSPVGYGLVRSLLPKLWKKGDGWQILINGADLMQIEIRGAHLLSFREKQIVTLKEMGAGTAEIARRLGISPSSVATLYGRARSKGYETVIVIPGTALQIDAVEEDWGEDDGIEE